MDTNIILGHKTNYLLIRDDVGRAKPTTRVLPPEDHAFGKAEKKQQENAAVITSSWLTGSHIRHSSQHNPRDFKKLNKKAV